jgi:hypothetical protein
MTPNQDLPKSRKTSGQVAVVGRKSILTRQSEASRREIREMVTFSRSQKDNKSEEPMVEDSRMV